MSFTKTRRAHALQPGDEVRFSQYDDSGVVRSYSGTISALRNDVAHTLLTFDDGFTVEVSRAKTVELLNARS